MDEPLDNSEMSTPDERPVLPDATLNRRALFGTVFGGVAVVAGLKAAEDRLGDDPAEKNRIAHSQLSDATPSSEVGTPAASPVASPVASPAATPVGPEQIGQLLVRRGESFDYPGEPIESDTLTTFISGSGDAPNLSPAAFRHDYQISTSYLDPLLWIDDETMEPRPWLAERWEWDESGKVVTFHLRRDVRWHNDSAFRARDVVFSFEVYRDDIDSGVRNIFNQLDSVEAIDNWTVEVRLLTPDANWLANAATQLIFQRAQYRDHWVSRPVGERTLSDFSWDGNLPVGTGPWMISSVEPDGIELERYDTYFAGRPHFRTLQLVATESAEDRIERWNDGEGDILSQVIATDLPALQDTPGTLYVSRGAQVMFAAFNFENSSRAFPGLLGDVRVRRALSLAIDRRRYAADVFSGLIRHQAAGTIAQPWAHNPEVINPEPDIERARELLAESGLTDLNNDGLLEDFNGSVLTFSAIVREDANPALIRVLDGLSEDFEALGVRFELRVLNPVDFTASWTELRDYDLIAYSYPLYPGFTDYDLYGSNFDIRINPQGWNPGGYQNEAADDLIKRFLVTVDPDLQREILAELQQVVDEDLFGLWFGFADDLVIARDDIHGYTPNKYLSTWNTRLLWRQP